MATRWRTVAGRTMVALLALTLVAACGSSPQPAQNAQNTPAPSQGAAPSTEPYKIGVLVGLSGGGAQIGQWIQQGAEVAADLVNKAGGVGGRPFTIVAEDSQWDPRKGVDGFNKLMTVDKVRMALVGGSTVLQAVAPIADQNKVLSMNVGAMSPSLAGVGKFTFHALQLADFDINVLARYAYDQLKLRKVAMMYVNNDTGKFNQAEFAKDFKALGGQIAGTEAFNQNDAEFGTQLAKIKAAQPDSLYLVGTPAELPFAVKQARQMGLNVQILSYAGVESQEFLKAAGDVASGIVYTTTYFDPAGQDPEVKKFVEAYKAKYGSEPSSPYIGFGYDAINILATALKQSKETGDPLREAILKIRKFPGALGDSVFRDDGTVSRTIAVKQIKDGKFQIIDVVKP